MGIAWVGRLIGSGFCALTMLYNINYHTTIQLLREHDVIFEFAATAVESLTRNSTGRISSS